MVNALLTYEFLQNAFLSGIIIGVIAPLLGLFIVVRRLALIADALSHVAFAGIAGSLYLSQQVLFFRRTQSCLSWNWDSGRRVHY